MTSNITPPTDELNFIIKGDLDILNAYDVSNGTGTIHIRNGGLYVEGLTDLDQTTINTTDGIFDVLGPNKIQFNVSGGATSSIEMTAEDASFFTTTAGTLTLSNTATDADGKIIVEAAGSGTDSVLINATNTTDGQITIQSAGGSTSTEAIKMLATDTTEGNVLIRGSGTSANGASVRLHADNTTSGQIFLDSAGGSSTIDAIQMVASDTSEGNILIQGNGNNTNNPAIKLLADNDTSGQIVLEADGNLANAIKISADNGVAGGIDIDATGRITIDSSDLTNGVSIATVTSGVPVLIGTATSVTTIAGDLVVRGATTTINTETLTVEDNIIVLNSGNGELDLDSGIVIRRFQTPNDASTGNVITGPDPIQESGEFDTGSSTPATLILDAHASSTDDFYNGWWIKVSSGTGVDQVRRIKDYVGATKTVTLYVTADNVSGFIDGLDLATAPASGDTYELYSDSFSMSYFDESENAWSLVNTSQIPDPVSTAGVSTALVQQYQQLKSGSIDVHPQVYRNVNGSASTTTITFTLLGHGLSVGDLIVLSDSSDFTPAIASGTFVTQTVPDTDTFTITVPDSTTSVDASSATLSISKTSVIKVNEIVPFDAGVSLNFAGITCSEDITIPKTSTSYFFLNTCTNVYGAFFVIVSDRDNTDGAFATFSGARSSGNGGSVTRLAVAKGTDGQRIDADWEDGENMKIRHKPAGSGSGDYVYRVRVFTSLI